MEAENKGSTECYSYIVPVGLRFYFMHERIHFQSCFYSDSRLRILDNGKVKRRVSELSVENAQIGGGSLSVMLIVIQRTWNGRGKNLRSSAELLRIPYFNYCS